MNASKHDKSNEMPCAPRKDSGQPGHPPSLIRVFAVHVGDSETFCYGLEMFLPDKKKEFYKYNGSYTKPPCFEVITWTVFKKPRSISQNQVGTLNKFDDLSHVMKKKLFCHMRTTKAQISLRIRTV